MINGLIERMYIGEVVWLLKKNCYWVYKRNRLIHKRNYFSKWDDICCLRFVETTNEMNEK